MTINKIERFENWMKENGACCDYIELREHKKTDGGDGDDQVDRGVHARQDIPADTSCIVVPHKCIITSTMGKETPAGRLVQESEISMSSPSHNYIALYVLWDRQINGKNSFFQPYYEILPEDFKNMPICWSDEQLEMLEGSNLVEQIQQRNSNMLEDYRAINKICSDFGTYEDFRWIRICISSRCFGMKVKGEFITGLVPQADMLNHERPKKLKYSYNDELEAMEYTSLEEIPCGHQIFGSYGVKCNNRFMLSYGFAIEDNVEQNGYCPNTTLVELELDDEDEHINRKLKYWHQVDEGHHDIVPEDSEGKVYTKDLSVGTFGGEYTEELFSLLRFLACNDEELDELEENKNELDDNEEFDLFCHEIFAPINVRNERVAMRMLMEISIQRQAQYPTTLAQDNRDLENHAAFPLFSNKRNAKIHVRGEKQILQHYFQWGLTAIKALNVIERTINEGSKGAFDKFLADLEVRNIHETVVEYCSKCSESLLGPETDSVTESDDSDDDE